MNKLKINYNNTFSTSHSRDYYRGQSFHFSGEWMIGSHYKSDDYVVDFVVHDQVLLACAKSHLSTLENEPINFIRNNSGTIIGVNSNCWDFVISGIVGKTGKVYFPTYDNTTGKLTWDLISEEDIDESDISVYIPMALADFKDDADHRLVTDDEKSAWNDLINQISNLNINKADKADLDNYVKKINNPFAVGTGLQSAFQKNPEYANTASGRSSAAFGESNTASGIASIAVGADNESSGARAFTSGRQNIASGNQSTAQGYNNTASGAQSHAEGSTNVASGVGSHVEGYSSTASGPQSHAEGRETRATRDQSHAEGFGTIAQNKAEHAEGQYNKSNKASNTFGDAGNTIHSVGIGTADNARKNAVEVMQNGDVFINGIGGYDGTNPADASTLKEVIDSKADSTDLNDYVTISDIPIEKGSGQNSVQQKGTDAVANTKNAVAIGEGTKAQGTNSFAEGSDTLSGQKGYKYTNTGNVTNQLTLTSVNGLSVGDVVSIVNDSKYPNCATITEINGITITLDSLPFDSIVPDLTGFDDYLVYVSAKPNVGDVDIAIASHAEGAGTKAQNYTAHAEGRDTQALGSYSHAEGRETIAQYAAHAEGKNTQATGECSHSEGFNTIASGNKSHAEGNGTISDSYASHTEGYGTVVSNNDIPATINNNVSGAAYSHAEGNGVSVTSHSSHGEGRGVKVTGNSAHGEGLKTIAAGNASHAEGNSSVANGSSSHAEGHYTITQNLAEHAEGRYNRSNTGTRHSVGIGTSNAARKNAFEIMENGEAYLIGAGGYDGTNPAAATDLVTLLTGNLIWIRGNGADSAVLSGSDSRAEGQHSVAEGERTVASGKYSHAEGFNTTASSSYSHSEGFQAKASGVYSHAEGYGTTASGDYSHSEGELTIASGINSHAEGSGTIAQNKAEHAEGKYNKSNKASTTFGNSGNTIHSVGIGASSGARTNAFEIMQNGDIYVKGLGSYNGTNPAAAQTLKQVIDAKGTYSKPSGGIPASDLASGVIPTVPQISTNITTDASSNTKTASPKAVKDYVDANGMKVVTYGSSVSEIPSAPLCYVSRSDVLDIIPNAGGADDQITSEPGVYLTRQDYSDSEENVRYSGIYSYYTFESNASVHRTCVVTALYNAGDWELEVHDLYDEIHPTVASSQPSGGFLPNIMYNLGTLSVNTTFALATPADANIVNHYYWTFDTGSTALTITWPSGLSWFGGSAPTINTSKHYEISVLNGIAVAMEV